MYKMVGPKKKVKTFPFVCVVLFAIKQNFIFYNIILHTAAHCLSSIGCLLVFYLYVFCILSLKSAKSVK